MHKINVFLDICDIIKNNLFILSAERKPMTQINPEVLKNQIDDFQKALKKFQDHCTNEIKELENLIKFAKANNPEFYDRYKNEKKLIENAHKAISIFASCSDKEKSYYGLPQDKLLELLNTMNNYLYDNKTITNRTRLIAFFNSLNTSPVAQEIVTKLDTDSVSWDTKNRVAAALIGFFTFVLVFALLLCAPLFTKFFVAGIIVAIVVGALGVCKVNQQLHYANLTYYLSELRKTITSSRMFASVEGCNNVQDGSSLSPERLTL